MDKSQKHYTKQKIDRKDHILYDTIYLNVQRRNLQRQKVNELLPGPRGKNRE